MAERYWRIDVVGWGVLWAYGTEERAEAWRVHKALWEGCVARKREVQVDELPSGKTWERLEELIDD